MALVFSFMISGCENDDKGNQGVTTDVVAASAPYSSPSDGTADDASSIPEVSLPPTGPKVDKDLYVAFGDSITVGDPATNYPAMLSALLNRMVVNEGRGGETTSDGRNRLEGVLSVYRPGWLIILYGANDAIMSVDPDKTLENLSAMIDIARMGNTIPVAATLTPMFGSHALYQQRVLLINQRIRTLARRKNVRLARLDQVITSAHLLPDGLHPNADGLRIIAQVVAGVLGATP